MRTLKIALAAAIGSLALAGAAQAQDAAAPPFKLSFNIGANTDYEFRGVSQTDNKPSIFGGVDATIFGIGYALTDHVGLDVRYHDTDEHGFGKLYDSRVVAGIKVVF